VDASISPDRGLRGKVDHVARKAGMRPSERLAIDPQSINPGLVTGRIDIETRKAGTFDDL